MKALSRAGKVATPLLLLAITLLGGVARLTAIGQKGLWIDEAFSVWLAWQRLPETWGWIARIDQHPPLYYTLLNVWVRLGDGAATVRLLSAVLGTLTIPVIFLLGRRLAGRIVGLLAALILAASPFHVRFAQEARMYALLALVSAAAMACLAHLLSAGPDPSLSWPHRGKLGIESLRMTTRHAALPRGLAWIGYVVFTAAAMLTHSAALLLPLSANLFVFGLMWRQGRTPRPAQDGGTKANAKTTLTAHSTVGHDGAESFPNPPAWGLQDLADLVSPSMGRWLLAQAAVLLLWGVIWLPSFVVQVTGVYRGFWLPAPTWRTVVDMLGNFLSAHLPRQQMRWADAIWLFYAALLALGIAVLRRRPAVLALLLVLFLTPVIGELLVSLSRPVFYDRTLIWATIPLYVLLAAGIAGLRRLRYIVPALAILVAANGLSLHNYYANYQKEGWREAAEYVSRQARSGDLILFNASWTQIPFDYYFRDSGTRLAEHGLPVDLFERGLLEPKMAPEDLPRLRGLIDHRRRVWLVYGHNWYTDPQGLIPAALSGALQQVETRSFEGLEIQLYEGSDAN